MNARVSVGGGACVGCGFAVGLGVGLDSCVGALVGICVGVLDAVVGICVGVLDAVVGWTTFSLVLVVVLDCATATLTTPHRPQEKSAPTVMSSLPDTF